MMGITHTLREDIRTRTTAKGGRPQGRGKLHWFGQTPEEQATCRAIIKLRLKGLPWRRVIPLLGPGWNARRLYGLVLEFAALRQYAWLVDEVGKEHGLSQRAATLVIGEAAVDAESARQMVTGEKDLA